MPPSLTDFLTALSLALAIEGALYALFPDAMQRMMRMVLDQPAATLRIFGAVALIAGLGCVWLLRS